MDLERRKSSLSRHNGGDGDNNNDDNDEDDDDDDNHKVKLPSYVGITDILYSRLHQQLPFSKCPVQV